MWHGLTEIPSDLSGSVLTIGVFDGVHRGHQLLIQRAVERARELEVPAVMMTFDPHPAQVFASHAPQLLSSIQERASWAAEYGIDAVLVMPFTRELAALSPVSYIDDVIVGQLHAKAVVIGENFTFGYQAAGTPATLVDAGVSRGFTVDVVALLEDFRHGQTHTISSSFVRRRLGMGDVLTAAWALGREYQVSETVAHGAGRGGAELGFPTANLYVPEDRALPKNGVYAGWMRIDQDPDTPIDGDIAPGVWHPAAISVGTNPTFGDHAISVEAFILEGHADLYDRPATVRFASRIRGMDKFENADILVRRMHEDVRIAKIILGLTPPDETYSE